MTAWIVRRSLVLGLLLLTALQVVGAQTHGGLSMPGETASHDSDAQTDPSAALHVLAGTAAALLVSAAAYPLVDLGSDQRCALLVAGLGLGGALTAGVVKELVDLCGWGQPQWTDLLLTAGGGLLAAILVYSLSNLQPATEDGSWGIAAVYVAFGLTLSLPVGEGLYKRSILSSQSRS
jgi:hypothetical protein